MQLLAIAEIVFSSLKIDSGKYGQIKEGFEMPEECLEADNNQTWWCKIIKNEDNSEYSAVVTGTKTEILPVERDSIIAKICLNVIMVITTFIGFVGVSYGEQLTSYKKIFFTIH